MNYFLKNCLILSSGSILFSWSKSRKTSSTQKSKVRQPGYPVYLLTGQSNMPGRGALTIKYVNIDHDRVLMPYKKNKWVSATNPLHFDKPAIAGAETGLSFGEVIANAYPKDTIGLVPCAVGGITNSEWQPGAFDKITQTYPYDDAIKCMKEAQKKGVIKGVIRLKEAGDSKPNPAKLYPDRITTLIERIKSESGDTKLPFVMGVSGRYRGQYCLFNTELAKVPLACSLSNNGNF